MLLPHNKVSGGVQDSQIMIPSFFDRFYVMPPLTNGVHYKFSTVMVLSICPCFCCRTGVPRFYRRLNCQKKAYE